MSQVANLCWVLERQNALAWFQTTWEAYWNILRKSLLEERTAAHFVLCWLQECHTVRSTTEKWKNLKHSKADKKRNQEQSISSPTLCWGLQWAIIAAASEPNSCKLSETLHRQRKADLCDWLDHSSSQSQLYWHFHHSRLPQIKYSIINESTVLKYRIKFCFSAEKQKNHK